MNPPLSDAELIRRTLGSFLDDQKDDPAFQRLNPRAGGLTTHEQTLATATGAVATFQAFGGIGWLQTAETQEVWEFHPDAKALTSLRADAWPECGELFNPDTGSSLHLRRATAGWLITTFAPSDTPPAHGLLLTERLLHRDFERELHYEVAYEPRPVGSHEELRPVACRFLGFVPLKAES